MSFVRAHARRALSLSLLLCFFPRATGAQESQAPDAQVEPSPEEAPSAPAPLEPFAPEGQDAPEASPTPPAPPPPVGDEPGDAPSTPPEPIAPEASVPQDEGAASEALPVKEDEIAAPDGEANPSDEEATSPGKHLQGEVIEVTIANTRVAQTPGSAHVLRAKDLERFEYDDPHALLMQVPGVYVRQEDGTGLRPNIGIRGANPDRSKKLTLMEDGVLFGPAPYSAPAAYYFPLTTRMVGVRVLKGPSAITSGPQTIGGAIDFVSAPVPTKDSAYIDLAGGQYGYGKAHVRVGTGTEKFGLLIEGVHLQNSGFMELPRGGDTGSRRNDWMIKGRYSVDGDLAEHEFGVKLAYADEISNESYLGLSDADFRANPYRRYPAAGLDRMTNHRTSVVLSHLATFKRRNLEIKTQAYRHDYTRAWRKLNSFGSGAVSPVLRNPNDLTNQALYGVLTGALDSTNPGEYLLIGPNDRTFVSQGVQSVLSHSTTTGVLSHDIEAGVRLHHDSIDRKHTQDSYRMEGGRLVLNENVGTDTTTSNSADSYALAMHIVDAIHFRALTLTPGVRLEIIGSRSHDRLTGKSADALVVAAMPGVGAFYALGKGLGLLAGVYRGFSPPPPASKNKPEYSVNYEAGARFTHRRSRLEAIGFYNDYQNVTAVCTASGGCLAQNVDRQFDGGKARIYGAEVYGRHELAFGPVKLPLSLTYTFTRGEFMHSFASQDPIWGNVRRGDAMPYLPKHQLTGIAALEYKAHGVSASVTYVAPMREEPGSMPLERAWTTDSQLWADVEAHARVYGPIKLYANLRNLMNAENIVGRRPYGARVNAPRWVQVGVKVNY